MIQIRGEIDEIISGKQPRGNNTIVNAPHPQQVVISDKWDRFVLSLFLTFDPVEGILLSRFLFLLFYRLSRITLRALADDLLSQSLLSRGSRVPRRVSPSPFVLFPLLCSPPTFSFRHDAIPRSRSPHPLLFDQ
jgi:hypothetical protein